MSEKEILESIENYKSIKNKKDRARKMRKRSTPTDYNKEIIERFVPCFRLRRSLYPYETTTLNSRKVTDFILFVRRGKHELRISINV